MLRDSVFEQDHINVVMKVLFLPTRWFLPFQFAGTASGDQEEAAGYYGERLGVKADCAFAIWSSTVGTASCNNTIRLSGSE